MEPPEEDLEDRREIWDMLQGFWMDTDPEPDLARVAAACAASKYTLEELEQIYWNEVRPAVAFNLRRLPAPEWAGFDRARLAEMVLARHRFGRPLPWRWLRPYANGWWRRLRAAVLERRERPSGERP